MTDKTETITTAAQLLIAQVKEHITEREHLQEEYAALNLRNLEHALDNEKQVSLQPSARAPPTSARTRINVRASSLSVQQARTKSSSSRDY
jgi:hypothetical protein